MKNKKLISFIIVIIIAGLVMFWFTKDSDTTLNDTTKINYIIDVEDAEGQALVEQVKQDPENLELLLDLALMYHQQNHFAEEILVYEKMKTIKPNENLYNFNTGNAYLRLNDLDKAIESYWVGINQVNQDMRFYGPLLDIYEFHEDKRELVQIIEMIDVLEYIAQFHEKNNAQNREYNSSIAYLARAYELVGNYEKAIDRYQIKMELNPSMKLSIEEKIEELKNK